MGFFTEGYDQAISLQQGNCTPEEYDKNVKDLLKSVITILGINLYKLCKIEKHLLIVSNFSSGNNP